MVNWCWCISGCRSDLSPIHTKHTKYICHHTFFLFGSVLSALSRFEGFLQCVELLLLPLCVPALNDGKNTPAGSHIYCMANVNEGLLGEDEPCLWLFEELQKIFMRCWNWFHMRGGHQTASADFLIKLNEERRERKEEPVVALILNLIKRPEEVKIEKSSVLAFSILNKSLVGV